MTATPAGLHQMDGEIAVPVSEGVGRSVQGTLESQLFVEGDRPCDVCHLEHGIEARHQPRAGSQLQLAVTLGDEAPQTAVTDREIGVGAKPHPPLDRLSAAVALHGHSSMLNDLGCRLIAS